MPAVKKLIIPPPSRPPAPGVILLADSLPEEKPAPQTLHEWLRWVWLAVWTFCVENPGWGVSIALHSTVIVVIGAWVIHGDSDRRAIGINAMFGDKTDASPFDHIGLEGAVEVAQPDTDLSALSGVMQPGGDGELSSDFAEMLNGSGAGAGCGAGAGDGGGPDPGLGAAFFGSQGAGKTFVYIVDMSGSMFGARFERARKELISSIAKLKPEQQFYVFFFSDQTFPLFYPKPAKGLLPATKSNRDKATRWIRAREPGGLTNPIASLRESLAMKPDVIFLLTDGEVDDPANLRELILKNNKGSTIHTIAFENEDGAVTLESIAKENKGSFRFVR